MGLYVGLFVLLLAIATFRGLQEKKRREERRRRMLQNLHTALDV